MYDGQMRTGQLNSLMGRIRVSYDVGNYPVSTMYSFEMVADEKFHASVDRGLARSIINDGSNDYLKLTNTSLSGWPTNRASSTSIQNWQYATLQVKGMHEGSLDKP
ncbi:hypothetical protein DOY81_008899 [Sarcophaga bullata]|nr:hypothetical protein DOY81_008899 [Sarcophaga bullata]